MSTTTPLYVRDHVPEDDLLNVRPPIEFGSSSHGVACLKPYVLSEVMMTKNRLFSSLLGLLPILMNVVRSFPSSWKLKYRLSLYSMWSFIPSPPDILCHRYRQR